jgi:hypothetical protein
MEVKRIPYWVERVASQFRKEQRGEIAPDESIEEARRLLLHERNKQLPRKHQKEA